FINGFFILFENQYDIGDMVRVAGVKGTVERMSLRQTVLRDEDGTVHIVPNSAIQIVSNTTRDWSQFPLRVVVAYSEPSESVVKCGGLTRNKRYICGFHAEGGALATQRWLSLAELVAGAAIVIGHNVYHVIPNEVPILFVLGLISVRWRDGSWAEMGLSWP